MILPGLLFGVCVTSTQPWTPPTYAFRADSRPAGALATRLERSLARLKQAPFTLPFIAADVSFGEKRIFTEYSGDISGRVLGVSATEKACGQGQQWPVADLLRELQKYQKPDGHFGAEQNLAEKIVGERDMPILWGNGRLLIGLVEACDATRDPLALSMAQKLGDYYLNTDALLDKPELVDRFGNYAAGFATCYFSGLEGLVGLSRIAKDPRYLEQAERMAKLMAAATQAKEQHSHGRLCALRGLLDLYEATGKRDYLDRVTAEHEVWVKRFLWPTGGISEMSIPTFSRNEGCAEADWLRLNLQLWRLTGKDSCLDLAEMTLKNELSTDQFANGGFGHRVAVISEGRMTGYYSGAHQGTQEAYWCCSEHGPRALLDVASSAVAARGSDVYLNLYEAVEAGITVKGAPVKIAITPTGLGEKVAIVIHTERPSPFSLRLRVPAGCRELRVNGKRAKLVDGRAVVTKTWHDGDRLELEMPFVVRARPEADPAAAGNSQPTGAAYLYYGPYLVVAPTADDDKGGQAAVSIAEVEKGLPRTDNSKAGLMPAARLSPEAGFRCRFNISPKGKKRAGSRTNALPVW